MFRPAGRNENAETDDRFSVVCLCGVLSVAPAATRLAASFLCVLTPHDPLTLPVALLAGVAGLVGYLQAGPASTASR